MRRKKNKECSGHMSHVTRVDASAVARAYIETSLFLYLHSLINECRNYLNEYKYNKNGTDIEKKHHNSP